MMPLPIQIQRRLVQPEVWRFVSFASTVVGLLCYALSSSFKNLFGEWSLLKIFVYSLFSFIICLIILFVKVWQHSRSLRFKAHMAFLVLAITSAYSFFFDKAVNRKPDAYSLISCAGFAMMSLTLSRQIHCGCEVDLLYFFLGILIVQLMKIKLLFGMIGAGFSYSLIILRSSLDDPTENGYLRVRDQNHVAIQMDVEQSNTSSALLNAHQQPNTRAVIIPGFMAAIQELRSDNQTIVKVFWNRVNDYLIDKDDQVPVVMENDHNFLMDLLRSQVVDNLHENVKLMIKGGFEKKCLDKYSSSRRRFVLTCLMPFGPDELVTGDFDEKKMIRMWIKASNIALEILFPNERRLCDRVFLGFPSIADLSFVQVCSEVTTNLLNFANAFANRSRSSNHLPSVLQVLETLHNLIPTFESVFSDQCSVSLRFEAIATAKGLWESIRDSFVELENLIRHDMAQAALPGGICPVTIKVMNSLSGVFKVRDKLELVFQEYPVFTIRQGTTSSLSIHMTWIIDLLESHLEAKSKSCGNPTLGYVFLMNNGRYIEHKAKEYELGTILGNDWIKKHAAKVHQNLEGYQRSSWDKVLSLLKQGANEPVATELMKENLKLFNMQFKEICKVQSAWFVLDEKLREEIIISLEKRLWPSYGSFIGRLQTLLGSHAYECIDFSMYDIDALLNDLFRGNN